MNEIPEEIVNLAESGEVKPKTAKPQEVAYAVLNCSYQNLGESVLEISARDTRGGVRDCGSFCNCML